MNPHAKSNEEQPRPWGQLQGGAPGGAVGRRDGDKINKLLGFKQPLGASSHIRGLFLAVTYMWKTMENPWFLLGEKWSAAGNSSSCARPSRAELYDHYSLAKMGEFTIIFQFTIMYHFTYHRLQCQPWICKLGCSWANCAGGSIFMANYPLGVSAPDLQPGMTSYHIIIIASFLDNLWRLSSLHPMPRRYPVHKPEERRSIGHGAIQVNHNSIATHKKACGTNRIDRSTISFMRVPQLEVISCEALGRTRMFRHWPKPSKK